MDDPATLSLKSRVNKASRHSLASRWNIKLLRGLEAALKKQPEADISLLLPPDYSATLKSYKTTLHRLKEPQSSVLILPFPDDDIRSRMSVSDSCTILFELSSPMKELIRKYSDLSTAMLTLLADGKIIYKSAWTAAVTVLKISPSIVVKINSARSTETEVRTLAYLQKHMPNFPVPKPHGLVRFGRFDLLFMSFVTGVDLENAWPQLHHADKCSISKQIDQLLSELKLLPHTPGTPFGGLAGEGCKDARRSLRISANPIMDTTSFEDFIFAGSKVASPLFLEILRSFKQGTSARVVFTHGDIRPANIIVHQGEDSTWEVVALIDWENSGFYPAHWECVKMTNNLTLTDNHDWYLYLPESSSPRRYPIDWLVDRVLDRSLKNS